MQGCDAGFRRGAMEALEQWTRGADGALASEATGRAGAPFGELDAAGLAGLMGDLRRAMPDLERRDDVFAAGTNRPDKRMTLTRAPHLVACCGTYLGTFREPFAGIPPTGGVVALPYGEAHHVVDGRILRSWLYWDLPALMRQAGVWPMAPCLGAPGHWPAPRGGDGVRLAPSEDVGALEKVLVMHEGLNTFDGADIASIDMSHWHPDFTYWAGGNIGACRGVDGFRQHHQIPYRRAFSNITVQGHYIRIADGPFAVTGGDIRVTHSGADYMGLPATGRTATFKVMDFYRFDDDGVIAENWLPNDTLGLLAQMGVDALARVAHHGGAPRRGL